MIVMAVAPATTHFPKSPIESLREINPDSVAAAADKDTTECGCRGLHGEKLLTLGNNNNRQTDRRVHIDDAMVDV